MPLPALKPDKMLTAQQSNQDELHKTRSKVQNNDAGTSPEVQKRTKTVKLRKGFSLFMQLPPELRHRIWDHAVAEFPARIIYTHLPRRDRPQIGTLGACHDSRNRTLKAYKLCEFKDNEESSPDPLPICFRKDIIRLSLPPLGDYSEEFFRNEMAQLLTIRPNVISVAKRVALHINSLLKSPTPPSPSAFAFMWAAIDRNCPEIEEVIFIYNTRAGIGVENLFEIPVGVKHEKVMNLAEIALKSAQDNGRLEGVKLTLAEYCESGLVGPEGGSLLAMIGNSQGVQVR